MAMPVPDPTTAPMLRRSLCLLPLWAVAAGSAEAFPLEALMARLAAVGERRARFNEQRRFAGERWPLETRGHLLYRRPSYLEMGKEYPFAERTVIDGNRLTVAESGHQPPRTLDFADRPELAATIEAMRAPLAGDLATLSRLFAIKPEGSLEAWTLELVPRDPKAAKVMRLARLAGRGDWIAQIGLVQANGDEATMQMDPE